MVTMALQGNQTVYQRPEGESTQWEDIHRKLGNFPAKEPVQVSLGLQAPYGGIEEPIPWYGKYGGQERHALLP